jgi:hypothetical protein
MTARFTVDLLHPGRAARTWRDWFVGPQGRRRLLLTAAGCAVVILVVWVAQIPTYWRLSTTQADIPRLRRDLAALDDDLRVLRADLQALALESKRQVRWGELMTVLSQQVPPAMKLVRVEAPRAAPPPAGPPQAAQPAQAPPEEHTLRIEAVTPLKAGGASMLEIARFMAGLVKDPAVHGRFQLKSWEIKPSAQAAAPAAGPPPAAEQPLLQVVVTLAERGR